MDNKQGVCLFYQRTGTCKNGDNCPLSHVQEERGITTKYDDRIWQSAQVVPSALLQECPRACRGSSTALHVQDQCAVLHRCHGKDVGNAFLAHPSFEGAVLHNHVG